MRCGPLREVRRGDAQEGEIREMMERRRKDGRQEKLRELKEGSGKRRRKELEAKGNI